MMNTTKPSRRSRRMTASGRVRSQRGVTLVIAVIALVVLTVGAIAMTRSANISLRQAGNLAFKRDLVNQGERAIAAALAELRTGNLSAEAARQNNRNASNYSAYKLDSSEQGIPNVLVNDDTYASSGFTRAALTDASGSVVIRYVIDRQCSASGVFDSSICQTFTSAKSATYTGIKNNPGQADATVPPPPGPVYRISVRITGPRGVQTFTQTTVSL
jgi:type IV pilus assembly protein PilX